MTIHREVSSMFNNYRGEVHKEKEMPESYTMYFYYSVDNLANQQVLLRYCLTATLSNF